MSSRRESSQSRDLPVTQPAAQRRQFDELKWTAIAIENPCIVLIGCDSRLTVMLARDRKATDHGDWFFGLQLVSIPNGLHLRGIELLSSVGRGRLPDESLYMKALIRHERDGHRLIIDGRTRVERPAPFEIKPLTDAQFAVLSKCPGQQFRSLVVSLFKDSLPASIVNHRPWTLRWAGHSLGASRTTGV